ncbi:MAG: DUF2834 domain-containing protein [Rhodobacteraceae bacterium]|nr:DUF2834 domain-containing protein [Paracoccaceae bacterium]
MSILRLIYLSLAIVGIILPIRRFLAEPTLNASSFSTDMIITAAALSVWIIAEVYVRRDYWVALVCIPAIFAIGVSCAFPLYLFLRTRPIK